MKEKEAVAEQYKKTFLKAEHYKKNDQVRQEIAANRQLISQLERNVRQFSWDPHQSIIEMKKLIKVNADLIDSETGANNYADFCIDPETQHKNRSSEWKSSITADHPMFKNLLKTHKEAPDQRDSLLSRILKGKIEPRASFSDLLKKSSSADSLRSRSTVTIPKITKSKSAVDPSSPGLSGPETATGPGSRLDKGSGPVGGAGATSKLTWMQPQKIFEEKGGSPKPTLEMDFEDSPDFELDFGDDDFPVENQPPAVSLNQPTFSTNQPSTSTSTNRRPSPTPSFLDKIKGPASDFRSKISGPAGRPAQNRNQKPIFASNQRKNSPIYGSSAANNLPEQRKQSPVYPVSAFKTAHEQLIIDQNTKKQGQQKEITKASYGAGRKCLGTRPGPAGGFKPPVKQNDEEPTKLPAALGGQKPEENPEYTDERYKNIDQKMIELIMNEIMDTGSPTHWDDIAGLEFQKKTVKEIVVLPMLRPDIFTGLRGPPKGLLLFGPPGTGKTLIGKCIASQSKSTFFSISASSLTSKWVGEGEKMVRALFAVAKVHQPSVIFIDEIDSLLSARSETEHESSRRMKTEFLVQLDGAGTSGEEKILIVGATNRPQELDEAARRRLVKRLLIPLPEKEARRQIIHRLLGNEKNDLTDADIDDICEVTDGYSGADMANVCREAAMGPIRSMDFSLIESMQAEEVRPINKSDLTSAIRQVKASVSDQDLQLYADWNEKYGAGK